MNKNILGILKTEGLMGHVSGLLKYGYTQSPHKVYIYQLQKHINN